MESVFNYEVLRICDKIIQHKKAGNLIAEAVGICYLICVIEQNEKYKNQKLLSYKNIKLLKP